MKLSKMIRMYMAAQGLQQKEIAEQIGINESTLSRLLSDRSMPDAESFMKVLNWLTAK